MEGVEIFSHDENLQDLSAEQSLALGDSYAVDESYEDALTAYTAALAVLHDENLVHFRILSHRAAVLLHLKRHDEAKLDCVTAYTLVTAGLTGLRPGETETCLRRQGLAALGLKQFEEAQAAMESAKQLANLNHRPVDTYDAYLEECKEGLAPAKKATKESKPMEISPAPPRLANVDPVASSTSPSSRPVAPKYQYYQSDKVLTIAILAPNVQEEDLRVNFEEAFLTVQLRVRNADFTLIAGKLFDKVDVDKCRVQIRDDKVLIKLRKQSQFEWSELLVKKASIGSTATSPKSGDDTTAIPTVSAERPRPYSSHKDWDEIEKAVTEEETKEKPQGDEAMQSLFQQIYQNADEDTRRAMIKSYQTSGGTVLSTNWKEVGETDYEKERSAPDGMEWKTWEGKKLPMKDDTKHVRKQR